MLSIFLASGNAGQNDGGTAGGFSDKGQVSTRGLDGLPESGQQEIAAIFEAGKMKAHLIIA